jgi:hypothetical protein
MAIDIAVVLAVVFGLLAKGGHVTRKRLAGQWSLCRAAEFALRELRK